MELKKLKLTEIKPYGKNPRKNDGAVDAVAASIVILKRLLMIAAWK